mmetsp:Transcript_51499/g.120892  ORF Transcript_51499/g.120892 Transcript_51499/m.120892 type:complete len:223 (+) Transcript_51499:1292-1960(+)
MHADEAGRGVLPLLRRGAHRARPSHRGCARGERRGGRARHPELLARHVAFYLRRPPALPGDVHETLPRLLLHGRWLPPRRGRVLLDHRTRGRRAERVRPSPGDCGDRVGAGDAPGLRRGGRGGRAARHQGSGHLRLLHPGRRLRRHGRAGGRAQGRGAHAHRRHRHARGDRVRARAAQDALGENHAPHSAKDRVRRGGVAGRYFHDGRPHHRPGAHRQSGLL